MSKRKSILLDENPLDMDLTPKSKSGAGRRGRKRMTGDEKLIQTTVLFSREQLDWLYDVCADARRDGGKPMKKAYLFRAFVDLAREKELDLRGCRTEEDLRERVAELFK